MLSIFRTISIFSWVWLKLGVFITSFSLIGCIDAKLRGSEHTVAADQDCENLSEYIGVKLSSFPSEQYSYIRLVREGSPTTTDVVRSRATVIYDHKNYIIDGYCG